MSTPEENMRQAIAIVTAWAENETEPDAEMIDGLVHGYIAESGGDASSLLAGLISLAGCFATWLATSYDTTVEDVLQRAALNLEDPQS